MNACVLLRSSTNMHKTQGNYLVLYWCKFCSTLAKQFLLWVFCLVGRCLAVFIVVSWLLTSVEPNFSAPLIKHHYLCPRRYIHVCLIRWQSAKKIISTACHSAKLKLAFTSPDVIQLQRFLTSRIDFAVLRLFKFLKTHHLPARQVKNRIH